MRWFWSGCVIAFSLMASIANADERCVRPDEIATQGVKLGNSETQVRAVLGKPLKIAASTAEDDGGIYPTRALTYDFLVITLGRDSVESIEINGKRHPIAAGLVIGGSPDKLRSKTLIDNKDLARGAAFGMKLCGSDQMANSGVSIFVANGKVTRAILYVYGP